MIFTRDNLVHLLKNNVATVTFTKVSGEERTMKCTLRSEHIPNAPSAGGQLIVERKENANTVSVWDMEKNGWRSFRVDSVKSISVG